MIVLARKDQSFVEAANDALAYEPLAPAAPNRIPLAMGDGERYEEPSAAAHVAALSL